MSTLHLERVLTAVANTVGSSAIRLHALAHNLWQRRMTARNAMNPNALLVWISKAAGTSLNILLAQAGRPPSCDFEAFGYSLTPPWEIQRAMIAA